ncbi:MAG: peptidoglycan editing factor PgeF [Planctomycetota bacterium]|nr:MAG: peptidoglycan editing factor PgeF [Planctomycetota bacterium]
MSDHDGMTVLCPAPLLSSRLLDAHPRVVHGFTTRKGGIARDLPEGLDLARRPDRPAGTLRANWERAARAVALDLGSDDLALIDQVHGSDVLEVEAPTGPFATAGKADAVFTTRAGILLAVRTADCVPVLLAAPCGVAAVHSGWRGTAQDVVGAAVAALAAATGDAPEDFSAAIGPCISAEAYEVGEEVVEGIRASGLPEKVFLSRRGSRWHVDLSAAVSAQLRRAGVRSVDRLGVCTHGDARCFSHRRDGPQTGRQAALIALLPPFPG